MLMRMSITRQPHITAFQVQSTSQLSAATQSTSSCGTLRPLDIAGPFVLLAIETAILTPQVEFRSGWMLHLASPAIFNVLFFASALLMLISSSDLLKIPVSNPWQRRMAWLVTNLVLFYALHHYTLALHGGIGAEVVRWWHAVGWLLLVIAVGVAAWLTFIPFRTLVQWLCTSWHKAVAASVIALTFAMLTPEIQSVWRRMHRPTVATTEFFLQFAGHEQMVSGMSGPNPILGTGNRGTALVITPFCAEQESLAAFLLLAAVLLIAHWPRVRKLRLVTVVLCGLVCLHLFNALRLFLLVEIAGTLARPQLAVSLAHSRLGGILLLAISFFIFFASRRWWYVEDVQVATSRVAS
jgi:hypothetical protein